jgi:4-hydroxy-3-polyprenylbenzoate decarboxylase
MKIALGISGASGAIYAKRLIEYLTKSHTLYVTISKVAKEIFFTEIGFGFEQFIKQFDIPVYECEDFYSPLASGSFKLDACIIAPCSMKTLSSVANGYADTLISRCGDVAIKQKHKLVLLPRETPLSAIHLENMLKLARLDVSIVVPSIAFYNKPAKLEDAIDFIVGKVLDELNIENSLYKRWGIDN